MKTQVVVDKEYNQIICTHFCGGKKHDFRLFKDSDVHCLQKTELLADSGYSGIGKIHSNSQIPKKSSKKKPLSKIDKRSNQALSSKRIVVENVIGSVKRYRILSERYRNRRKRFALRFNLISGIHNFEL